MFIVGRERKTYLGARPDSEMVETSVTRKSRPIFAKKIAQKLPNTLMLWANPVTWLSHSILAQSKVPVA